MRPRRTKTQPAVTPSERSTRKNVATVRVFASTRVLFGLGDDEPSGLLYQVAVVIAAGVSGREVTAVQVLDFGG